MPEETRYCHILQTNNLESAFTLCKKERGDVLYYWELNRADANHRNSRCMQCMHPACPECTKALEALKARQL